MEKTTSNSIAWAIHYLALRPDIQDRLRAEVVAMGKAPNMDYTTIESLRLLDNLYHEVLRMRSGGKRRCGPPPEPRFPLFSPLRSQKANSEQSHICYA